MHNDEMNKIEVRNVEKYPLFPFSIKLFLIKKNTVFLFVVQIE